jgi:hypothetical protein
MLIHTCTDLTIPTCAACYHEDIQLASFGSGAVTQANDGVDKKL